LLGRGIYQEPRRYREGHLRRHEVGKELHPRRRVRRIGLGHIMRQQCWRMALSVMGIPKMLRLWSLGMRRYTRVRHEKMKPYGPEAKVRIVAGKATRAPIWSRVEMVKLMAAYACAGINSSQEWVQQGPQTLESIGGGTANLALPICRSRMRK
jgi:hypothetical protein